ncbi:MAG: HEAT repeat domain-containing protein [Archangiaceae bacterium]|nr:HEAT repeat domain-containing protein [Archangiaceae bacterium]
MLALCAAWLTLTSAMRGETCKEVCARYVTDPRLRANVCGRCFTDGDRGAWAAALGDLPQVTDAALSHVLDDPDWAVRWGALRAIARRRAVTDARALSDWVASSPDRACSTALHVAGARHQTPAALLQPQPAALCWERRVALTRQVEVELYSEQQGTRLEALAHLAAFLERAPTRVVLDAMKSRAAQTDALSAGLLVEASRHGGAPAGKALLEVKKSEGDEPVVNRLLAVWAQNIDAQHEPLRSEDPATRRAAIAVLADLAPLSAPELESALADPDPSIRRAVVQALARGAGVSVAGFAQKKLDPRAQVPAEARTLWLAAVGSSQDPTCGATLRAALGEAALELGVRAAALPALVDCEGVKALPAVAEQQRSPLPALRAGAAVALGGLPLNKDAPRLLETSFADADPLVLAAAARAAGLMRHRPFAVRLAALVGHADPLVRRDAVDALGLLESAAAVPPLIHAVTDDRDAAVRLAAARVLGTLGSAAAVPALIAASERDRDEEVKFVAAESLRKLGFKRSP